MHEDNKCFKAFNFDLDTKLLEKYHPSKTATRPYYEIEKFFLDIGFEHRQGSGYRSKERLSNIDVFDMIDSLRKQYLWIDKCIKRIDVTDVGEVYDLVYLFEEEEIVRDIDQSQHDK